MRQLKAGQTRQITNGRHFYGRIAVQGVLLPLLLSLSCCLARAAAAALDCPADVIRLDATSTPAVVHLQPNTSYKLGAGVFVLNSTVEVLPGTALCVAGGDKLGAPAGVTRLLSPEGAGQLHFVQYGGFLQLRNMHLEGRAGSLDGGGGVRILKHKDGAAGGQPATFISNLVTFKRNSPRAFANDNDTAANLSFANSAFVDNFFGWHYCDGSHSDLWCGFTGPAGAAGVTSVSDVIFKGSSLFRNNSWGALYIAAPVTVSFQGPLAVVNNTKHLFEVRDESFERPENFFPLFAPVVGAGFYASNGARLLFKGRTMFKGNRGAGGGGMALKNATATFAVGKHVQFLENEVFLAGSGAALNADASKITFNGPVTVARNSNIRGAGGAFYLQMTNVTFNAAAEIHDNRASGWNGYAILASRGGGAICAAGSRILHNAPALYRDNTAVEGPAGALALMPGWGMAPNSLLAATHLVTFRGNAALGPSMDSTCTPAYPGGAMHMLDSFASFGGGVKFISNKATPECNAIGFEGAVCAFGSSSVSVVGAALARNNSCQG